MTALFVASTEALSGKTAVCAGIGLHLVSEGLKVGYMKPLSLLRDGKQTDSDIALMKQVLNLEESEATLNPISVSIEELSSLQPATTQDKVRTAYARVAQNNDFVLLEAADNLATGSTAGLSAADIGRLLDAKVLLVVRYTGDAVTDEIVSASILLGDRFFGVILNAIPTSRLEHVKKTTVPLLESKNIKVLGSLEENGTLLATTVGDLVENLGAEIVTRSDKLTNKVETLMVGAMSIDSALEYFRRKSDKAVIVGGDRPDIQLAALETSTACMILTGGMQPNPLIVDRSTEQGVPILIVQPDTMATVKAVEDIFGRTKFKGQSKLNTIRSLISKGLDVDALKVTT